MKNWHGSVVLPALAVCAICASASLAVADDFYKNRQMKLIIGSGVGGAYNHVARTVARHLPRNIPGNPTIIPQNKQGASSAKAANYLYNVAPQDGSVIASVVQTLPQNQLFGFKNLKFDAAKFQWIGSPQSSVVVFAIWHGSKVKTLKDAMQRQAIFGAASFRGADGTLPLVINKILGTKFKVVTGYKGAGVTLAMERGEIEGRGGATWDGWNSAKPDWIKQRKIRILLQIGLKRDKNLPNVPLATDLAKTDEQRQILKLFSTAAALGRPLIVGPGVPANRVAILRNAFRRTMKDPKFLEDAKKSHISVAPAFGEDLQTLVVQLLKYSPAVVTKAKNAMKK